MNDSGLTPMEFNVIVKMDPTEEKVGSIIIPVAKQERDELASDVGTLIAVSPHAFTYADWPEGAVPPKPGDRVMFAQYKGRLWKPKGDSGPVYRIIKDQDIVAVVDQQPTLAAVA